MLSEVAMPKLTKNAKGQTIVTLIPGDGIGPECVDAAKKIKATVVYEGPLSAPVKAGDIVGKLVINAPGREPIEVKVAAGKSVSKLNFLALAMRGLSGGDD
jgi:isocitrate/isopropylmalate dehydrogenase